MKPLFLLLALALAACGNQPDAELATSVRGDLVAAIQTRLGDAPPERARPARAQLEALNVPVLWAAVPDAPLGAGFVAVVDNQGRVTFLNGTRQTVTLHGGQLVATRGFGDDLMAYRSDTARDPSAAIRPPEGWPDRVERIYRFNDGMGGQFLRAAVCLPATVGPTRIEIFDRPHDVVEIVEDCRTPRHAFVNRYWVDPASGFVWRSEQWSGPARGALTIEVVVPAATPAPAAG